MKLILSAREGFALKADGNFLGNFNGDACIEDFFPCFIEMLPHSGKRAAGFFCGYGVKNNYACRFFTLPDGIFASAEFEPPAPLGFELILQKKFYDLNGTLVTVYRDGQTRIVAENCTGVETVTLPPVCHPFECAAFGSRIAVFSAVRPTTLTVFETAPKLRLIFNNVVDDFEFTPIFRTKTRLFCIEQTTVTCEWSFSATPSAEVKKIESLSPYTPDKPLTFLRRAFFERILYRLPVTDLLCDQLRPNEDKLPSYLGSFTDILPDYCSNKGLCLTSGNSVKIYDVQADGGKITNITEI